MKGKDIFTKSEIETLRHLIILRNKTASLGQRSIRNKMRNLGFYGRDDWQISNLQFEHLENLIVSGRINVTDDNSSTAKNPTKSTILVKTGNKKVKNPQANKDENYVLDLCDKVLGFASSRQHRFNFLVGDENKKGKTAKLPVDGFYEELNIVVEYMERQHTEKVSFFDKTEKMTISGVHRGEQRKIYDKRRRQILPKYKIKLIEISYCDFNPDKQKKIIRNPKQDEKIVRKIFEQSNIKVKAI